MIKQLLILMIVIGGATAAQYGEITMKQDGDINLNPTEPGNFEAWNGSLNNATWVNSTYQDATTMYGELNMTDHDIVDINLTDTDYLSSATMIGNLDTGGYDIGGSEYVDEADVDWGSLPIRIYNGSTGSGLLSFVKANGRGTYYVTNKIIIDEPLIWDYAYCRIIGGNTPMNQYRGTPHYRMPGLIEINVSEGEVGITISTSIVSLVDLWVYQKAENNDDVTLVYVDAGGPVYMSGVTFQSNNGTNIIIADGYSSTLSHCIFRAASLSTAVTGVQFGDATHRAASVRLHCCIAYNCAPAYYYCYAEGVSLWKCGTYVSTPTTLLHTAVYMLPLGYDYVKDNSFVDCCFDYCLNAPAILICGDSTNLTNGVTIQDTYAWSPDDHTVVVHNCTDLVICGGGFVSDKKTPLRLYGDITHVHIDGLKTRKRGATARSSIIIPAGSSNVTLQNGWCESTDDVPPYISINIQGNCNRVKISDNVLDSSILISTGTTDYMITGNMCTGITDNSGGGNNVTANNLIYS